MFVSLNEQKKRLSERLDRPSKYWKYNPGDIDERLLWPKYQEAYQVSAGSDLDRPCAVARDPVQPQGYSRLAINELLIEALKESWPPADFDIELEKKRLARSAFGRGRRVATRRAESHQAPRI